MNKKEQPIIVGLDIGTTKVVAIAGRKNEFGKLETLGFGLADSAGVSHGIVLNIEQCIRSIELAIANCLKSNPNLDVKEVYVGIAGKHIRSLTGRGDRVRPFAESEICKEDIELLIRDQQQTFIPAGDKIIDIIPQDYTVDGTPNIVDPIGMSGIKIGANFHIITADRNAIKNIMRCVDKSGLKARDLVLQPLASAASVMNDEDLEAGVAIVDIGGGTTDMAVFYDGILKHTSVIPFGGVNITEDIKMGLGVLRAQAEQMKVNYGTAIAGEANPNAYITIPGLRGLPPKEISVTNLSHIIEARMVEILEHVLHQLKQIGLDKRLYGGIILTGGGAQLKHIKQLTEFVTGLGTRIGYPNEHLAGGEHSEALMNPAYATCIGLILRGYHDFENDTLRFVGEHANSERSVGGEKIPAPEEVINLQGTEEDAENNHEGKHRPKVLTNMVNVFKKNFMEFFGEMEEQDLNNIKN
jgi:cell division protein FtsA